MGVVAAVELIGVVSVEVLVVLVVVVVVTCCVSRYVLFNYVNYIRS